MANKIKITKIELVTNKGDKIHIGPSKIEKFFQMSKLNPKNPGTMGIKGLNKFKILRILFLTFLRKLCGKNPALTEQSLISLIFPKTKFKKILSADVFLLGKKISFNLKNIHLLNLLGDLRAVIKNNQYNLKERDVKNKVVIDAGANNGEFAILAILLGAKKVYSFEPVSKTRQILSKNIKLNDWGNKIEIVPKALGDENENAMINFNFIGDGAATIGPKIKGKDSEEIEIIKLDDFVKKNKISKIGFIKMDIEGFEERALLGAKNIMKRDKPILSLSAYHKPDDKKRLPKVIKSIRKDYNIILNNFDEEDFYCY